MDSDINFNNYFLLGGLTLEEKEFYKHIWLCSNFAQERIACIQYMPLCETSVNNGPCPVVNILEPITYSGHMCCSIRALRAFSLYSYIFYEKIKIHLIISSKSYISRALETCMGNSICMNWNLNILWKNTTILDTQSIGINAKSLS